MLKCDCYNFVTILFILSDIFTLLHIRASVGVLLKHLVTITTWQDADVGECIDRLCQQNSLGFLLHRDPAR